jgi:hypothetical protein
LDKELVVLEAKTAVPPTNDPNNKNNNNNEEEGEDNSSAKEKKNKKKKKKGPPPKEIMDFMRQKRSILKKLKERQRKERADMVQDYGNLQRLFIVSKNLDIALPSGWREGDGGCDDASSYRRIRKCPRVTLLYVSRGIAALGDIRFLNSRYSARCRVRNVAMVKTKIQPPVASLKNATSCIIEEL